MTKQTLNAQFMSKPRKKIPLHSHVTPIYFPRPPLVVWIAMTVKINISRSKLIGNMDLKWMHGTQCFQQRVVVFHQYPTSTILTCFSDRDMIPIVHFCASHESLTSDLTGFRTCTLLMPSFRPRVRKNSCCKLLLAHLLWPFVVHV